MIKWRDSFTLLILLFFPFILLLNKYIKNLWRFYDHFEWLFVWDSSIKTERFVFCLNCLLALKILIYFGDSIDWLKVQFGFLVFYVFLCEFQSSWWKWVLERRVNVQSLSKRNVRHCWHKCFVTKTISIVLIVMPKVVFVFVIEKESKNHCIVYFITGPRWASWNLGVFLCIRCAGIHRNLGVHISRVRSVNLDTWTPEQVVSLQQMGNSRARAVYEAQLPDGFRRPQTDSALESFIRAKYEHKKYMAREWVPTPPAKANWDKEVDEEMEKLKRKKKSSSSLGIVSGASDKKPTVSVKSIPIPAPLPKPKVNLNANCYFLNVCTILQSFFYYLGKFRQSKNVKPCTNNWQ